MQLKLIYEKYIETQRNDTGDYTKFPPLFRVVVEDEQRNRYVFRSDGSSVKPSDLLFVHMMEGSQNHYSYHAHGKVTKVMTRPTILYLETSVAPSKAKTDAKLIKSVIQAVTSTPVDFPADDRAGLSLNTSTITISN